MMKFHPDSDLRPYAGERPVDRPLLELGPLAPWHATVTVEPVMLADGRRYRIAARWHGPANQGSPVAGADRRQASAEDIVDDQELARAIAHAAADDLRAGQVPDLLALKRTLQTRES